MRGELPVFSQTFEDIEILASSHPLIDMHYRQADRGAFQGSILAFALPHGLIWWSQANLGGPGIGIIPEGYLMVAICARGQEESWHGRPTQIGAATSELGLHHRAAANHDAICWMLEWEYVLPLAERMGLPVPDNLGRYPWISPASPSLTSYSVTLNEFLSENRRRGGISRALADWLEEYLVYRFLSVQSPEPELRETPMLNTRLARALAIAIEELCERPLCLSELCARFHVHERTLRHHFANHYGMSPTAYHQLCRLNLLRQHLLRATPKRGEVSRLASLLGFWHMGRLGQQYRRLFGEAPNETLLRRPSQDFQSYWEASQPWFERNASA